MELQEIRLSFNQYIYHYSSLTSGEYTWKEYFVGTQTLEGFALKAGESKDLSFSIDYESQMREDEKKKFTEKQADIKEIKKMGHFRKDGKGMEVDGQYQLVVVFVLAGGEEIKDVHQVKID